VLTLGGCSHQFSWPRRSSAGDHYQVCVLCGDAYSYDWNAMRRLDRRPEAVEKSVEAQQRTPRWTPRARRLQLSGPMRYRQVNTELWNEGELKNLSRSGLLFAANCLLPKGARIQIELDMPAEICGGRVPRRVMCEGQVARMTENPATCAAQVFNYVFLDQRGVTEMAPRVRLIQQSRRSRKLGIERS